MHATKVISALVGKPAVSSVDVDSVTDGLLLGELVGSSVDAIHASLEKIQNKNILRK